jgi:hypothetical protein
VPWAEVGAAAAVQVQADAGFWFCATGALGVGDVAVVDSLIIISILIVMVVC